MAARYTPINLAGAVNIGDPFGTGDKGDFLPETDPRFEGSFALDRELPTSATHHERVAAAGGELRSSVPAVSRQIE